jgi:hypothetical protein
MGGQRSANSVARRVEPSMSVKRKVTVPVGSAAISPSIVANADLTLKEAGTLRALT